MKLEILKNRTKEENRRTFVTLIGGGLFGGSLFGSFGIVDIPSI